MLRNFIVFVGLLVSIATFGQTANDTISQLKVDGVNTFQCGGKTLTATQLTDMLNSDEVAARYLKSAKASGGFASVLAYAGGFCIGYPLGAAIGGGEVSWGMVGIGCGLVAIALPIASSSGKKLKMAINAYNHSPKDSGYRKNDYDLKLAFNSNGLGLILRF